MNENTEPQLAPPGAGLPKIELFLGRLFFALNCRTGSRASFNARFQQERQTIRKLLKNFDAESAARRVLIERCRGLEDSSRYWSIWMTLDHLRLVNHSIADIISQLVAGTVPEGVVSTADVKPSPAADASVVAAYEASCETVLETVAGAASLQTPIRYAHPWFGPLDAFGWHALVATHMGIHRVQLAAILESLKTKTGALRSDLKTKTSFSFWLLATLGLAWNVFGVIQFLGSLGGSVGSLMSHGMTAGQAELYASLPVWMTAAFATGVFGGVVGCVLLLLRRKFAVPVFRLSLLGYVVLYIGDITQGVFAAFGSKQVVILTLVLLISIGLFFLATHSKKKGILE